MKDLFSDIAENYQRFRPEYPVKLLESISQYNVSKDTTWDCATGNGQIAIQLTSFYQHIFATDISANQLKNAIAHDRIQYSQQPAEKTNFQDQYFDLIIVGQAVHWFSFEDFYREVNRTLKPDGILALVGYHLVRIIPEIDAIIDHYYHNIIGPYWDKERKYIDERYQTIPFPFAGIDLPEYDYTGSWTFDHLAGFLGTWSALKHFIKKNQCNPLEDLLPILKKAWGDVSERVIHFPVFSRIGRKYT